MMAHAFHSRTPRNPRSGIALIVVLGLVTALMTLAIAFSLSMRMGSLGARRFTDRARARNFERAGLVLCMTDLDELTQGQTNVYPWFLPEISSSDTFVFGHAFASSTTNEVTDAEVLVGAWSNFVPASLWADATNVTPLWREVTLNDEETRDVLSTNGRVAFVAINCSGVLDPAILGPASDFMALASNDVDWVQIDDFSVSSSASEFAKDMAIHRGYTSLPEMSALNLNRGLAMPSVSELFVYSYDPDPNSIPTNYADIGNFNIVLTNKFNINSITNYQPADYAGDDFQSNYIARVTNLLDHLDSTQRRAMAWSIVNLLDEDSIPQSYSEDSTIPWREDYCAEAVPSINEIVLAQRSIAETPNAYGFSVETWFPFTPGTVTAGTYALHVMVFTNRVAGETPQALADDQHAAWSFQSDLPEMRSDDSSAWFVAETPPGQDITFPVTVSRLVTDSGSGVSALIEQTEYLPIGVTTYANDTVAGGSITITVTNRVWFLARVQAGSNIVDEAMGYDPSVEPEDDKDVDGALFEFREVAGYEVDDPRFNGHRAKWLRSSDGDSTLGTTNAVFEQELRAQGLHGQGVPIVHLDRPLEHVWEIGQAVAPDRGPWNTIDLMDANREASLLDTLMTHEPLEEPWEYGRVHLSSPFTNVLTAVLSNRELSFPLPDDVVVTTLTEPEPSRELAGTIISNAPGGAYASFDSLWEAGGTNLLAAVENCVPSNFPYHVDYMREQVIGDLVEKVTFRQNIYLVFIRSQALAGNGKRAVAETRRLYVVYRDAYSGRYFVKYVYPY